MHSMYRLKGQSKVKLKCDLILESRVLYIHISYRVVPTNILISFSKYFIIVMECLNCFIIGGGEELER